MIRLLKKIKYLSFPRISFHPLFLGYLTYLFLCGAGNTALICLIAVFLHESGHFIISKKFGIDTSELVFYPYGAVIEEDELRVDKNEWIVALSGPVVSLILGLICAIIVLINSGNNFWNSFLNANLTIFIFNLLPAYPLDGARAILSVSKNPLKTIKYLRIGGIAISIILILCFIVSVFGNQNYSFLIMGVFLLIGSIRGIEREMSVRIAKTLLSSEKQYKKGVPVTQIAFDEETPIHKVLTKISPSKITDVIVVRQKQTVKVIPEDELLTSAIEKLPNTKLKDI